MRISEINIEITDDSSGDIWMKETINWIFNSPSEQNNMNRESSTENRSYLVYEHKNKCDL